MTGKEKNSDKAGSSKGVSRRDFLKVSAGGVAGGALLAMGIGAASRTMIPGVTIPENFTSPGKSEFAALIGDRFRIRQDVLEKVDVQLTDLTDLRRRTLSSAQGEAFSLLFRGPTEHPIRQGTHMVEHKKLGEFPLFVVPVHPDDGSLNYEAIINRMEI